MSQLEKEREHAFRLAEEHRALAAHYLAKGDARRTRDNRLKAEAWAEYAYILPTLPL